MAKRRTLGILLLFSHLFGLVAPAWAQEPAPPQRPATEAPEEEAPRDVVLSENIESRAGGWNVATPALIAGSELYQGWRGEGDGLQVDDIANRRVLGGLAGDVGALGAVWLAARFVPLPPVAKITLMTAAGFLGWEFASGDHRRTDWVELGAQIAAASAVQFALPVLLAAVGVSIGPIALMAVGIAAAVGTGMLVSWLRSRGKDEEPDPDEVVLAPAEGMPTAFLGPEAASDEDPGESASVPEGSELLGIGGLGRRARHTGVD